MPSINKLIYCSVFDTIFHIIWQVDPSGDGADLAAADLTITSRREEAVDFVGTFQHLGISIIYRRPVHEAVNVSPVQFQILSPLSPAVWLIILASFIVVSI